MELTVIKKALILSACVILISLYFGGPEQIIQTNEYLKTTPPKELANEKVEVSTSALKSTDKNTSKVISHDEASANSLAQRQSSTQKQNNYNEQEKISFALAHMPISYHPLFKWVGGEDSELINDYMVLNESPENAQIDTELEARLSAYIYQHELSSNIQIERLNCSQTNCEIFGSETGSNTWNFIIESGQHQTWWTFKKETTRNGVSTNGELIFLTIIQR
ncbi:hypothetical protein [Thalassotalea atypica]|uniref:hypothetical protein n=1 Tax=Thalassotalea atypica TaxID=2054316 RepID=UPI002572236A|nr:hypothetical protein [Thalassotalea atypica]